MKITDIHPHGFSQIPKSVLTTTQLSAEAKGLYCVLTLLTDSDHYTVKAKSYDDLMFHANVKAKSTFVKYINELILTGYIIRKTHYLNHRRADNSYILIPQYVHFKGDGKGLPKPDTKDERNLRNRLVAECMTDRGYGLISRTVIMDSRLEGVTGLMIKAVYAYYCGLAGNDDIAYPQQDHILFRLGISQERLRRAKRTLMEMSFIHVDQVHRNGRYAEDRITLLHGTSGWEAQSYKGYVVDSSALIQTVEKQTAAKQTVEDQTAYHIVNKEKRNNEICDKQSVSQTTELNETHKEDNLNEDEYFAHNSKRIIEEIYRSRGLTTNILTSYEDTVVAVRAITEYPKYHDLWSRQSADQTSEKTQEQLLREDAEYDLFARALKYMLTTQAYQVKGTVVSKCECAEKVNKLLKTCHLPEDMDHSLVYGTDYCVSLYNVYDEAIKPAFEEQLSKQAIYNEWSYMIALIWDKLSTYALSRNTPIRRVSVAGKSTSMPDLVNSYSGLLDDLFI